MRLGSIALWTASWLLAPALAHAQDRPATAAGPDGRIPPAAADATVPGGLPRPARSSSATDRPLGDDRSDASAPASSDSPLPDRPAGAAETRATATGVPHWLENGSSTEILGMKPGERRLFLLDSEGRVVTALSSPEGDPGHLFEALGGVGGFADDRTVTLEGRIRPDGRLEPTALLGSVRRGLPDISAVDSPPSYWSAAIPAGTAARITRFDRLGTATLAEIHSADGHWRSVQVSEVAPAAPLGRAAAALFATLPQAAAEYAASHPEAAPTLARKAAPAEERTAPPEADSPEVLAKIRARSAGAGEVGERTGMSRLLEERSRGGTDRAEAAK